VAALPIYKRGMAVRSQMERVIRGISYTCGVIEYDKTLAPLLQTIYF
jgi:hypothetical protein